MRQGTEKGRGRREEGRVDPSQGGFTLPSSLFPLPLFQRLARALRVVFGMPDYDRYVTHRRACHPDEPVLSRADHYAEHLRRRYESGGPTRCC